MSDISPELSAAINAVTDGTCTQLQAYVLLTELRAQVKTIEIQKKRIDLYSTHNVLCADHRDKQTECPACEVETLTRLLKEARERAIDRSH